MSAGVGYYWDRSYCCTSLPSTNKKWIYETSSQDMLLPSVDCSAPFEYHPKFPQTTIKNTGKFSSPFYFPEYCWDKSKAHDTITPPSYLRALELCCLHALQHRGHVQRHRRAPVVNCTHGARTAVHGRRILPSNDRIWFIFLTFLTVATARLQRHSSNAHLTWKPVRWISSALSRSWFCNMLN